MITKTRAQTVQDLVQKSSIEEVAEALDVSTETVTRYLRMAKQHPKREAPKVLFFDIETSAPEMNAWSLKTHYIPPAHVLKNSFMLSWAAKWLGENEVFSGAVTPIEALQMDDERITIMLWDALNQADIIIGHNVKGFDRKKANTFFAKHGLTPPSPYTMVDTLLIMRTQFAILSNKLDEACKFFGLNVKVQTGGMELWRRCVGNRGIEISYEEFEDTIVENTTYDTLDMQDAIDKMDSYCQNDVVILEELYHKIKGYMPSHPNFATYVSEDELMCPTCGGKTEENGYYYTPSGKFQNYTCTECGANSRGRFNLLKKNRLIPNAR